MFASKPEADVGWRALCSAGIISCGYRSKSYRTATCNRPKPISELC
jgi:hypothetical protein